MHTIATILTAREFEQVAPPSPLVKYDERPCWNERDVGFPGVKPFFPLPRGILEWWIYVFIFIFIFFFEVEVV